MSVRTKPKPPSSVTATGVVTNTLAAETSIRVSWPALPKTGQTPVAANLYRNGSYLTTVYSAAAYIFYDGTAIPGTSYSYAVATVTSTGQESAQRSSATTTRPGVPYWISSPVPVQMSQDATMNFKPFVNDVDGTSGLVFSLPSAPSGYAINSSTGVLTPGSDSANVVIRVTDPTGLYAEATWPITIQKPSVLAWSTIPDRSLTLSHSFSMDVAAYLVNPNNEVITYGLTSQVSGLSLNASTGQFTGLPISAGVVDTVFTAEPQASSPAVLDWQSRIGGAGVVWHHAFESDAEVDQFRWTGDKGNDPLKQGVDAAAMYRVATGGPGGTFGYLEILHPGPNQPDVNWWRPFSAIGAPGNGRTSSDPGAGKPVRTWTPTASKDTLVNWLLDFYGPETYPQEFYLQIRTQRDPRRASTAYNAVTTGGKHNYITTNTRTLTAQEMVTTSGNGGGAQAGDKFRMYVAGSPPIELLDPLGRPGQQVGGELSVYPGNYCDVGTNPSKCWGFSGGWDTLLYHITPGSHRYPNSGLSTVQVYAAIDGTKSYTKIWDQQWSHEWQTSAEEGWNALCLNIYQNGLSFPGPFFQRYAQIIFSTQWIPCPQV